MNNWYEPSPNGRFGIGFATSHALMLICASYIHMFLHIYIYVYGRPGHIYIYMYIYIIIYIYVFTYLAVFDPALPGQPPPMGMGLQVQGYVSVYRGKGHPRPPPVWHGVGVRDHL